MMLWFDRHRRLRDQLSAYIDGALNPAAAKRLEAHLGECEGCRTELEQLRSTVAALRELPEARVPRSFALSPERAAAPRPSMLAPPLAFGARVAAAGVAVALAVIVVVDLGDLAGDGATEEVSAPQATAGREADRGGAGGEEAAGEAPAAGMMDEGSLDEDGLNAADGAAAGGASAPSSEPSGTPAAAEATAEDAEGDLAREPGAAETPAAGQKEVEAPVAAPSDGGIDVLTAAEIGLAAALAVLVAGSLVLALAGKKR